jgi:hypothetical protein
MTAAEKTAAQEQAEAIAAAIAALHAPQETEAEASAKAAKAAKATVAKATSNVPQRGAVAAMGTWASDKATKADYRAGKARATTGGTLATELAVLSLTASADEDAAMAIALAESGADFSDKYEVAMAVGAIAQALHADEPFWGDEVHIGADGALVGTVALVGDQTAWKYLAVPQVDRSGHVQRLNGEPAPTRPWSIGE